MIPPHRIAATSKNLFAMAIMAMVLTNGSCVAAAPRRGPPVDEVRTLIRDHESFAHAGDLDGIMRSIADDIVLLVPGTPLLKGKAAFRDHYASFLRALKPGTLELTHEIEGEEVVDNTIHLHGVASGQFVAANDATNRFANNFVYVLKRQATGELKFWRIAVAPAPPTP